MRAPERPQRKARADPAFPLHVHIASLFGLLLAITVIVVSLFHHSQTRRIVLAAHHQQFAQFSAAAVDALEQTRDQVTRVVDMLSRSELAREQSAAQRHERLELLAEIFRLDPTVTRLMVGFTDGDLLVIGSIPVGGDIAGAPHSARFVVDIVERERGMPDRARRIFYDPYLRPLTSSTLPTAEDPRLSPWYRKAINQDGQVTLLQLPSTDEALSAIYARRSATGRSAVAAEVRLERLGAALGQVALTPSAWIALLADGTPISQRGAVDRELLARVGNPSGQLDVADAGGKPWRLSQAGLPALGETRLDLVLAAPEEELFVEADAITAQTLWISLGMLLLALPVTWLASRFVARPLRLFAAEARAVQEFRFPFEGFSHSIVSEVDDLGRSMGAMQRSIHRFLKSGQALSSERDPGRLIREILDEALSITELTTGVLYVLSRDETRVEPAVARRAGQLFVVPPEDGFSAVVLDQASDLLATLKFPGTPHPIVEGLARDLRAAMPLVPEDGPTDTAHLLAVPLREPTGALIGALWLHVPSEAAALGADRLAYLDALAGVAAIALQNHRLLESRKVLLEAVVTMVAGAIDAKSPHTGGHCQRVPALLEMLADAACRAEWGPFADFQLDAAGWETLRMAGWLHDCGKVTTPEYVMDKATKLETLYNRLNEVRMRFEVLKCDARIASLEGRLAQAGGDPRPDVGLMQSLAELDEEFAFVARCNQGTEALSDDDRARLACIGRRTWQRTLDDRLGLSREECQRKPDPPLPLPVTERLLSDKPEHLIAHHDGDCYERANAWGFRVTRPPHRLNLGELHNLCVGRGTLTEEERHLINDHIVQSIVMLSRLPFPTALDRVPEIAGGHHERMDGAGYPRRLDAASLSLPARMLALADVFEALTAADRPYKHRKTVSEAVAMLHVMVESGHLDGDVLELALRERVFERYATRYLSALQGVGSG